MHIYPLQNKVQNYAWGSHQAIADLVGKPFPTQEPQAELWMGTHRKGPSYVLEGTSKIELSELIDREPEAILGRPVVERFGPHLPYLFKVLAAAHPLSIQAHPDKKQAEEGFARENGEGIQIDAPQRNYRDDNHKPEILCALTPFWCLNGFRPAETTVSLLLPVCPEELQNALHTLHRNGDQGLQDFFVSLMSLSHRDRVSAGAQIEDTARSLSGTSSVYHWISKLAQAYPSDMGMLGPGFLNLVCLNPGEALYLPAGQPHAYLDGVGIELMANSDNVLRGGLTSKHVDVAELVRIVRFEKTDSRPIQPFSLSAAETVYACPSTEFALSVLRVDENRTYRSEGNRSVEILLCTEGEGRIDVADFNDPTLVKKGDSLLIPACIPKYEISGNTVFYKASVPVER